MMRWAHGENLLRGGPDHIEGAYDQLKESNISVPKPRSTSSPSLRQARCAKVCVRVPVMANPLEPEVPPRRTSKSTGDGGRTIAAILAALPSRQRQELLTGLKVFYLVFRLYDEGVASSLRNAILYAANSGTSPN